jgi:hypothetical protein
MKNYYSKQGLWMLFLVCAFPLHLWTLLLAFRDISWLTEHTNLWDAIGVVSYGMLFAFAESILVFVLALLCGWLVPFHWGREKRLAVMGMLVLVLSVWAIISQVYVMQEWDIPGAWYGFLINSAHPLRIIYAVALGVVVPGIVLPVFMVYRSEKLLKGLLDAIDRISLLTTVYLFIDFLAFVVVIFRNI